MSRRAVPKANTAARSAEVFCMNTAHLDRRKLLAGAGALLLARAAGATPETMAAAIQAFTGGVQPTPGKLALDVAPLVDNGNTVPITIDASAAESPGVRATELALFNQRNPETEVVLFTLGKHAAKAQVSTRIRLANSQTLVAVARLSDGSYCSAAADVIVTLAACIEGVD
jgi:sulfur-oxidizing protein SoxY